MKRPQPQWHHQTPSGWADDRLMQAYDLIWEAWSAHNTTEDTMPELRNLLSEIEAADNVLADVIKGRVA
jgi:hypothetical protein